MLPRIFQDRYMLLSILSVLLGFVLLLTQFGPMYVEDISAASPDTEVELLCFMDNYRPSAKGIVVDLVDMNGNNLRGFFPSSLQPPDEEALCYITGKLSQDGGMLFIDNYEVLYQW